MKKTTVSSLCVQLLALLCACSSALADAIPELRGIRFSAASPVSEKVVLQLNGSYSPNVFTIKDETPRLVFDFADMVYTDKVKHATPVNGAMVKRIRVGMHSDGQQKTRVVLDLASLKGVNIDQDMDEQSSTLTITITRPTAAAAKPKAAAEKKGEDKKTAATTINAEPQPEVKETAPAADKAKDGQQPPATPPDSAAKQPDSAEQQAPKPATLADTTQTAPADPTKATALLETAKKPEVAGKPQPQVAAKTAAAEQTAEKKAEELNAAKDKTAATTPAKEEKAEPAAAAKAGEQIDAAAKRADAAAKTAAGEQQTAPEAKDAKATPDKTTAKAPAEQPKADPATAAQPAEQIETGKKPAAAAKPDPQSVAKTATTEQPAAQKADEAKATPEKTAITPAEPQPDQSTAAKTGEKAPATDAKKSEATGPMIESVKFDGKSPKGEMVLFKLNEFHPPSVHGVEEGIPRVICDFKNTQLDESAGNLIKTDGKYVKVIRISKSKKPDKVRVVLDLEPNKSYDLQQVFFKEENLFVLIINTVKS